MAKLDRRDCRAVSLECGVQNYAIAIAIAALSFSGCTRVVRRKERGEPPCGGVTLYCVCVCVCVCERVAFFFVCLIDVQTSVSSWHHMNANIVSLSLSVVSFLHYFLPRTCNLSCWWVRFGT